MNWGSAGEFFAMGGRGFYVWSSFGITALVLVIELLALRQRRRTLQHQASLTDQDSV